MSLLPCPVGRTIKVDGHPDARCDTMLQPYRGRMTTGVARHLTIVHQLPDDVATQEAQLWVESDGRHASR